MTTDFDALLDETRRRLADELRDVPTHAVDQVRAASADLDRQVDGRLDGLFDGPPARAVKDDSAARELAARVTAAIAADPEHTTCPHLRRNLAIPHEVQLSQRRRLCLPCAAKATERVAEADWCDWC